MLSAHPLPSSGTRIAQGRAHSPLAFVAERISDLVNCDQGGRSSPVATRTSSPSRYGYIQADVVFNSAVTYPADTESSFASAQTMRGLTHTLSYALSALAAPRVFTLVSFIA